MPGKTIRFYCEYCKETLAIQVTESLEKEFKEKANKVFLFVSDQFDPEYIIKY